MPTTPFLHLFGRSPIRPLEEHMVKVHACVKCLAPFFAATLAHRWDDATTLQQQIAQLENDADAMKRDLRLHLPKSLFMPVSRSDVLVLLNVQDSLANKAKDIAGTVLGRRLTLPQVIAPLFMDLLAQCIQASEQAMVAINELEELIETDFSGSEVKLVEDMIARLSLLEGDTDKQQVQLRQMVFNLEGSLSPIDTIFLYKIIEWTGDIADRAQDVGDGLQILLAR